jgi:uncharacterized protein (TIGR00730 family)
MSETPQPELPFTTPQAVRFDRALLDSHRSDPGEEAWRAMRIQGEFVNAFDVLGNLGPAVAVFGSARLGEGRPEYETGRVVGGELARRGIAVVTGGGPGIMEAANRGAREAGGVSVGLGIQLPFEDGFNHYIDLSVPFHYFFARKVNFVKYTQGAVILAGGIGTLDELFEVLTLIQTRKVSDYPVALVGVEFWGPLIDWIRGTLLAAGTVSEADVLRPFVTDDPVAAVAHAVGVDVEGGK